MRSYKKTQTRKNLLVKSSVGGKSTKKRSAKKNYQKGGDGQGNGGHDVGFPIQYFGGKLNRYFPAGSPELVPKNGAYGETVATSFGKNVPSLYAKNMVGPNLAPFPNSSGIQTGGKKKKNKKGGSIVNDLLSTAGNLVVPVTLLAVKGAVSKRSKSKSKSKSKRKTKSNKSKRGKK